MHAVSQAAMTTTTVVAARRFTRVEVRTRARARFVDRSIGSSV